MIIYNQQRETKQQQRSKTMKRFLFVALASMAMISSVAAKKVKINYYPDTMVVIQINEKKDKIKLADFNGNIWTLKGIEDWSKGDIVSVLMSDNGTPKTIKDDKIIKIKYSGYVRRWVGGHTEYNF